MSGKLNIMVKIFKMRRSAAIARAFIIGFSELKIFFIIQPDLLILRMLWI